MLVGVLIGVRVGVLVGSDVPVVGNWGSGVGRVQVVVHVGDAVTEEQPGEDADGGEASQGLDHFSGAYGWDKPRDSLSEWHGERRASTTTRDPWRFGSMAPSSSRRTSI